MNQRPKYIVGVVFRSNDVFGSGDVLIRRRTFASPVFEDLVPSVAAAQNDSGFFLRFRAFFDQEFELFLEFGNVNRVLFDERLVVRVGVVGVDVKMCRQRFSDQSFRFDKLRLKLTRAFQRRRRSS